MENDEILKKFEDLGIKIPDKFIHTAYTKDLEAVFNMLIKARKKK